MVPRLLENDLLLSTSSSDAEQLTSPTDESQTSKVQLSSSTAAAISLTEVVDAMSIQIHAPLEDGFCAVGARAELDHDCAREQEGQKGAVNKTVKVMEMIPVPDPPAAKPLQMYKIPRTPSINQRFQVFSEPEETPLNEVTLTLILREGVGAAVAQAKRISKRSLSREEIRQLRRNYAAALQGARIAERMSRDRLCEVALLPGRKSQK